MHRLYSQPLKPGENPDYDRHYAKPPAWETFNNQTQFMSSRGFGVDDKNQIVGFVDEMEKYSTQYKLGNVFWPSYSILLAKNLGDLVDEIKRRNLFLFDVMGYVPGSGPGGFWMEYKADPAVFEMLEAKLGDHWLGADIGEQDGRYIGGYAPQMYPVSTDRYEQYLNFQRHFERMGDALGNRLATLVSLNFGHYFLKEGTYKLIGAETAQALPNGQVYYAFIRGAAKQYGVPWFGNASVFNRWGYKSYSGETAECGPTKGTSLNLLKRLMYSHLLYNSMIVGFESGWFEGEGLSPIGRIQQAAQQWAHTNGQPGTMLTPVAIMTDFFAGWTFPRHLYTDALYRVWGNLPYAEGDYLTDGVLDMVYPNYQDASYFHDESGFITPTPYGDFADCLLSDAPGWLLDRYPVLVVAGELANRAETWDKLSQYVDAGGCLVLTAGNLFKRSEPFCGVSITGMPNRFDAGKVVKTKKTHLAESTPFELYKMILPKEAQILARCGSFPAAAQITVGKGNLIVLATPFGIPAEAANCGAIASKVDVPFPKPYPLLAHVRTILNDVFTAQMLFDTGEGLSVITCRKESGEYTLGICNNGLQPRPLKIVSRCGPITSIVELPIDQSEKNAKGFLPAGYETANVGVSSEDFIAGGDVRVFRVKVQEQNVEEIPHVVPPSRPCGHALPLRTLRGIKEEILARPTFFEHFDSVSVDWRYVHTRDMEALKREAGWIARQKLRVYVDLTSGINLYPDLRIANNSDDAYSASMGVVQDVMTKMEALGAHDLVMSLHRLPENNFTQDQMWASFEKTLREIAASGASHGLTVYLRTESRSGAKPADVVTLVTRINAPNLLLALELAPLFERKGDPATLIKQFGVKVGICLLSAPAKDVAGKPWTQNAPITGYEPAQITALLKCAPNVPVLFDAIYENVDQEYRDVVMLEKCITR